jgi:hypothetical protein
LRKPTPLPRAPPNVDAATLPVLNWLSNISTTTVSYTKKQKKKKTGRCQDTICREMIYSHTPVSPEFMWVAIGLVRNGDFWDCSLIIYSSTWDSCLGCIEHVRHIMWFPKNRKIGIWGNKSGINGEHDLPSGVGKDSVGATSWTTLSAPSGQICCVNSFLQSPECRTNGRLWATLCVSHEKRVLCTMSDISAWSGRK